LIQAKYLNFGLLAYEYKEGKLVVCQS